MKHRSTYHFIESLRPDQAVFLVDEDIGLSVTNDAERVVAEVLGDHPGRRIFYRDTEGQWDELKHDGVKFTGFAHPNAQDRAEFGEIIGRSRQVRV